MGCLRRTARCCSGSRCRRTNHHNRLLHSPAIPRSALRQPSYDLQCLKVRFIRKSWKCRRTGPSPDEHRGRWRTLGPRAGPDSVQITSPILDLFLEILVNSGDTRRNLISFSALAYFSLILSLIFFPILLENLLVLADVQYIHVYVNILTKRSTSPSCRTADLLVRAIA